MFIAYNGSNSGIKSYEISSFKSKIIIRFNNGKAYEYPCDAKIEKLAASGSGLNTWLTQHRDQAVRVESKDEVKE